MTLLSPMNLNQPLYVTLYSSFTTLVQTEILQRLWDGLPWKHPHVLPVEISSWLQCSTDLQHHHVFQSGETVKEVEIIFIIADDMSSLSLVRKSLPLRLYRGICVMEGHLPWAAARKMEPPMIESVTQRAWALLGALRADVRTDSHGDMRNKACKRKASLTELSLELHLTSVAQSQISWQLDCPAINYSFSRLQQDMLELLWLSSQFSSGDTGRAKLPLVWSNISADGFVAFWGICCSKTV